MKEEENIYSKFINWTYDERIDFFLKYVVDNKFDLNMTEEHKQLLQFIAGRRPDDRVAKILFQDKDNVILNDVIESVYIVMVYHNLCVFNDTYGGIKNYRITEKGIVINTQGGWLVHKKREEEKQNLEIENIRASIRTSKLVEENLGFQKSTTRLTIAVAILATFGTLGQWLWPKQELNKTKATSPIENNYCKHPCKTHQKAKYFDKTNKSH